MNRALFLFLLCILECSMTESGSTQLAEEVNPSDLPRVTVPLLGSTADVRGMELPKRVHTESVDGADLLKPHLLTIRLSDGRELTVPVRSMSLITQDGVVIGIYARRPMHPGRFNEVVADLRRTMKSLGIEPDEKMAEQFASWGDDHPGREEGANPDPVLYKAAMFFEPEIAHFHVHVQPDPERGWFYLMNFGGIPKTSRAAQEAAKAAVRDP
jgi:hypothetical protein